MVTTRGRSERVPAFAAPRREHRDQTARLKQGAAAHWQEWQMAYLPGTRQRQPGIPPY